MKIIKKSEEFGKTYKKTVKVVAVSAVAATCVGGAYLLGVKNTDAKICNLLSKAAFGGEVRLTHRPTGDSYKMILEKVVEEVVEG